MLRNIKILTPGLGSYLILRKKVKLFLYVVPIVLIPKIYGQPNRGPANRNSSCRLIEMSLESQIDFEVIENFFKNRTENIDVMSNFLSKTDPVLKPKTTFYDEYGWATQNDFKSFRDLISYYSRKISNLPVFATRKSTDIPYSLAEKSTGILFRGESFNSQTEMTKRLSVIFNNGLRGRGTDKDVEKHKNSETNPSSEFVSTSASFVQGLRFATSASFKKWGIIILVDPHNLKNARKIDEDSMTISNPYARGEAEVLLSSLEGNRIIGALVIYRPEINTKLGSNATDDIDNAPLHSLIFNSNYRSNIEHRD